MEREVKKTLNYLQLFKLCLQILLQERKEKWLQNKSYEFLYPAVRQSLKKKKIEGERKRMCAVEAIKDAFVPHSSPCHLRMHADIAWQGWG